MGATGDNQGGLIFSQGRIFPNPLLLSFLYVFLHDIEGKLSFQVLHNYRIRHPGEEFFAHMEV